MRVTVASPDDRPDDTAQRTALVDPTTLAALDAAAGDALAIRADDETVLTARAWEGAPESTLALSPVDCRNAGVSPGDSVDVRRIDPPPAERVTLRLADDGAVADLGVQGGLAAVENIVEGHPLSVGDRVSQSVLAGSLAVSFVTTDTTPSGPVLVTADTDVAVDQSPAAGDTAIPRSVTPDDLGGIEEALATLRRAVVAPLDSPGVFERFGTDPDGVLIYGPSGVGKTSTAVALAAESDARLLPVVPGGEYHDADGSVDAAAVRDAAAEGPTLVFFDDLDVLAPAGHGDDTDATTATLARLVDELTDAEGVTVLGAASAPEAVAAPLRRGDRFGREVAIETPDREARREILDVHFASVPLSGVSLDRIADRTPGFVGADIERLATEAVLNAVDRLDADGGLDALPRDAAVRRPDVEAALSVVSPSGLADHAVEQPDVSYDDIGGLTEVKRDLVRTVEWPLLYPDLFEQVQNDPPAGILLYGPPGTGKTMLARAVASSSGANFLAVSGPELFDRYVGESERAVRDVFERARQNAPAVVFFDEVDALATHRDATDESDVSDRVVSQLLTELDGIEPRSGVTVVGATNRPDLIDRALLRPGRFERILEVPLPDREARVEIFESHLQDVPATESDIDIESLATATEGYSGSDVAAVVREAGLLAMEESLRASSFDGDSAAGTVAITESHLERAVETVDRSVTEEMRNEYEARADDLRP